MMSQRRVRGILWQGWFFSLPETLLSWFKQVGNSSYKWRKADRRKITEGKKNEVVIWQAKRNGGRYCKKIKPSLQCVEVSKLKYIFLKCSLQHVLLSHRKRGKKVKVKNWIWPRLPQTQNVTSTIFKKRGHQHILIIFYEHLLWIVPWSLIIISTLILVHWVTCQVRICIAILIKQEAILQYRQCCRLVNIYLQGAFCPNFGQSHFSAFHSCLHNPLLLPSGPSMLQKEGGTMEVISKYLFASFVKHFLNLDICEILLSYI